MPFRSERQTQQTAGSASRRGNNHESAGVRRGQLIPARSRLGLRLPGFAGPCVRLALALHTRWLIVLAALCLGEQSILLYSAGEPLQGGLERLALFDDHFAHAIVVAVGLTARRALLSLLLSVTLPVCIRYMPVGATVGAAPHSHSCRAYTLIVPCCCQKVKL